MRIVDVADHVSFGLVPPCADPGFDHRSCDYWEDADRGSKAARASWFSATSPPTEPRAAPSNPFPDDDPPAANPFAANPVGPESNPFGPARSGAPAGNPFAPPADAAPTDNPFAPRPASRPAAAVDAPRKLALLARGRAVFGSYAKVGLVDDVAVAYAQFGPLSAYPRAARLRELYPQLPEAPLPAVITCIATTPEARHRGHALDLVEAVCADLAERGFSAVETYPERGTRPDATSAATPAFWEAAGFAVAVDDERFPVMRRTL